MSYCKFHPDAEATTKCAECGKEMCFYCDSKAFFRSEDEDNGPLCLECSLKKAKRDVNVNEEMLKIGKTRRTIALILWLIGLPLLALGGFGALFMIVAAIVYEVEIMASMALEEDSFTEKIKTFLTGVLICTFTCPFSIIKESNSRKKEIKKATKKLQEVQSASFDFWSKAADQGDAYGQYNLGNLYFEGDGVIQDYNKAIELFKKSAEQGCADASCILGYIYNEGEGVEKDYETAIKWFTKAAELGDPRGQFALGSCYDEGEGVPQDAVKAVEFYKLAAEQGDALSQCALGICYRDGKGVAQNMAKAFEYWKLAAEQGLDTAEQLLAENS